MHTFLQELPTLPWQRGRYANGTLRKQFTKPTVQVILLLSINPINMNASSKVVLVYIRCKRWAQKAWPFYNFFSTQNFITKIFYYDQMPLRRVDLHMLNSMWFNFQTAMLSLARDIQWSLKHCRTGEVWKLKILAGNSNFKIWVAEIPSSQPWVLIKLHFLASFKDRIS